MVKNLFGNRKAENYIESVKKMLKRLKDIGANTSIKVYLFHCH